MAAFIALTAHRGYTAGTYQSIPRWAHYMIAPQELTVEGSVSRAEGQNNDAYVYAVTSLMPFKSLLFQLQIPYISYVAPDSVRNQLGDPSLNMRFKAWHGDGWSFNLLSGVRAGSLPFFEGNQDLYPFSTGTFDLSAGIAFVDTLASVPWWVAGTGSYAMRVDEVLEGVYGNYSTLSAGLLAPMSSRLDAQLGALFWFQTGQATRQIYFADIDWAYSEALGFYVFGQVEAGPEAVRATDSSAGLGTIITF